MNRNVLSLALGLAVVTAWPSAAAETVAFWHFGSEETSRLEPVGAVHRDQPGPRPPEFPDFDSGNTAVKLDGKGAHFRISDPGDNSPFDFTNGDAITLEAWVNLADIKAGENLYVIGKGRTHSPGFPKDNQNWALRVREVNDSVRVSFLFFSAPTKEHAGDWHRWTSGEGFRAGSGWHHIAVTYTFGKPDSISGWLDGRPVKGNWDMGGATTRAPVVDNDDIWIGSSQGGAPANSFRGYLDEIAVHRGALSDETSRSRFRRAKSTAEAPDVLAAVPRLKAGKVVVQVHENLDGHDRWPADGALPAAVASYETELFLFPRLPQRYDDWGIRASWQPTVLLRAAAEVTFPEGRHRLLVRSRAGARLWLDGQVVVRTPFHQPGTDGHGSVPPEPKPPAPGARLVGYGDYESIVEVETKAGLHKVVLEVLVGGKKFRPEMGDCCVALQLASEKQFRLLSPQSSGEPVWLTDEAWDAAAAREEAALTTLDDQTRRAAASQQDDYWRKRHDRAAAWAAKNLPPPAPEVDKSWPVLNPIDQFLAAKMERALAAGKGDATAAEFHETVLPILRDNCFRCHGEKERGGLKLNSREAAFKGGDSKQPAVVPGKPETSALMVRLQADEEHRMPPKGERLKPEQVRTLETWIREGAKWPAPPTRPEEVAPAPLTLDAAFLRRVYLDTVGVPPTAEEARAFLNDRSADKRNRLIDRLLTDPRWADHWVSYWLDVLAENPNLVKPTLNNTGPFRYFLYEALRDDKPMDRLVTELVMMRGGAWDGGSAGFAIASDNDAPMAAKAHILGTAFLGVEMQCARCHDSPFHSTKQRDLFSLAAMLERKPLSLPPTSTVPAAFFDKKARASLIKVSLKPGETIEPVWPFPALTPSPVAPELLRDAKNTRELLAATITSPENTRFAQVLVNRLWKRLMGAGIVEPVHDWEGRTASHPELLQWLAHELVTHGHDLKHVVKLILTSHTYQREARGNNLSATPERRFFNAPDRRRLTAEQVVDSLFVAGGRAMDVEELTFDADSRQAPDRFLNLGAPRRAWQFTSLANERDRPSLSMPKAQAVIDVLEAFGWKGSRQNPFSDRETDPDVLQPGVLANGTLSVWISRLSDVSALTEEAAQARSPEELTEAIFLRFLSRLPTREERERVASLLTPGFGERLVEQKIPDKPAMSLRRPRVSWTNHLSEESNRLMIEYAQQVRAGPAPTPRLRPEWRERMEDAVWSLFNLPEFVWMP
jgi:mono/diheme cytochrome c family protein